MNLCPAKRSTSVSKTCWYDNSCISIITIDSGFLIQVGIVVHGFSLRSVSFFAIVNAFFPAKILRFLLGFLTEIFRKMFTFFRVLYNLFGS